MQNIQDTSKTPERSFISTFSVCMTVTLNWKSFKDVAISGKASV